MILGRACWQLFAVPLPASSLGIAGFEVDLHGVGQTVFCLVDGEKGLMLGAQYTKGVPAVGLAGVYELVLTDLDIAEYNGSDMQLGEIYAFLSVTGVEAVGMAVSSSKNVQGPRQAIVVSAPYIGEVHTVRTHTHLGSIAVRRVNPLISV